MTSIKLQNLSVIITQNSSRISLQVGKTNDGVRGAEYDENLAVMQALSRTSVVCGSFAVPLHVETSTDERPSFMLIMNRRVPERANESWEKSSMMVHLPLHNRFRINLAAESTRSSYARIRLCSHSITTTRRLLKHRRRLRLILPPHRPHNRLRSHPLPHSTSNNRLRQ